MITSHPTVDARPRFARRRVAAHPTMQHLHQAVVSFSVVLALIGFTGQAFALNEGGGNNAWPAKLMVLEEMKPLTRYRLKVPGTVSKGKVTGPAVLRVHVDGTGAVVRAALHTSCGNADLDEAALHAMREMRFRPTVADDAPIPVTLVVPVHVPQQLGRSD